jgi:uncharacterized protein (DUF305 family)
VRIGIVPTVAVLLLAVAGTTACRSADTETTAPADGADAAAAENAPPIIQPGAPGQPSRVISAEEATDLVEAEVVTDADVRFMQGMIGHHGQAIDMSALVADRTERATMRDVALRITLSQEDEIKMMQAWLAGRGEAAPGIHDHHAPGAPLMPGMLTPEEMDLLEVASGTEFDLLFLEFMIKHHEGALLMVDELYATPGAAEETVIATFTGDVIADQRAEMDRMTAMINAWR